MPETDEEWQEMVNWAEFLLDIHAVLVSNGGMKAQDRQVEVDRCKEILAEGAALGFLPNVTTELRIEYLHPDEL